MYVIHRFNEIVTTLIPKYYSSEMSSCIKYFESCMCCSCSLQARNGNKTETVGYKFDAVIRVNFLNPTINKYFNTTLYMNTTL